jgi:creatinine amidohydrolase
VVLAARPDLVREEVRRRLPENPRSLVSALRQGLASFEAAGGGEAYFGDPAAATAEEGRATIETLGAILAEAMLEAVGPEAGRDL